MCCGQGASSSDKWADMTTGGEKRLLVVLVAALLVCTGESRTTLYERPPAGRQWNSGLMDIVATKKSSTNPEQVHANFFMIVLAICDVQRKTKV